MTLKVITVCERVIDWYGALIDRIELSNGWRVTRVTEIEGLVRYGITAPPRRGSLFRRILYGSEDSYYRADPNLQQYEAAVKLAFPDADPKNGI